MRTTASRFVLALLAVLATVALLPAPAPAGKGQRDEGILAEGAQDAYAGSAACAPCHEREHRQWAASLKATFVRSAAPGERLPHAGKTPALPAPLLLVVGKARRLAFVDASWTVLPWDFNLRKRAWHYKKNWDGGQDYRIRCAPCHLTATDPASLKFKELGVGCEACHGPGADHAANGDPKTIRVPGRTDGKATLDTCRRCHNQRNNHAQALESFREPFHK